MTSLTRTAITARKIIRYGLYGFVLLLIMRSVIKTGLRIYRTAFPPPPPPPTVEFGILTPIPLPAQAERDGITYKLETPTGELPTLPEQMKVYFMPQKATTLFSLDEAKTDATTLGFSGKQEQLNSTVYRFYRPEIPAYMEMDIINKVFSLSYDLAADPSPLENNPPATETAKAYVKNFLSSANLSHPDLEGPVTFEYLKVQQQRFVEVVSLSEADLVKVNLYRQAIDDYPSLTPKGDEANVWFIVSGSNKRESQVIAGQYHYFPIDLEKSSTYPIKSAEVAWQELQAGGGYIHRIPDSKNVVIRRVYLAYMDPGVPSEFYQPVIVFEGDNDFVAYVPAVSQDYYGVN